MLSLLYFLTQFLQEVLHYSPIDAGLAYLPLPVAVGVTGLVVSRLVGRFGIRPFLLAGPLLVAGGLWWVSLLTSTSSYPSVFGPLVVVGLGMGLSFVPLTLNAVAGVPDREAGLGSGLLNTSQQFGGSLGLAALVTVAASAAAHHVATAGHTLGSAPVGASVASQGAGLAEAAHVAGFQAALRGGALAAGIAFLVSLLVLRAARATTGAGAGNGAGEGVAHDFGPGTGDEKLRARSYKAVDGEQGGRGIARAQAAKKCWHVGDVASGRRTHVDREREDDLDEVARRDPVDDLAHSSDEVGRLRDVDDGDVVGWPWTVLHHAVRPPGTGRGAGR
jgi:hypothetical protein